MSSIKCAAPECENLSASNCPTCKELNVPEAESSFCSKECFQKAWEGHKQVHKKYRALQKAAEGGAVSANEHVPSAKFQRYIYTGPLRAGYVSPQMTVPDHVKKPDYATTGEPIGEYVEKRRNTIHVYTPQEIERVRRSCQIAREVMDICANALRVGITTDEIDKIAFDGIVARGAYPSPLNYMGFPKSICTSINEVICHGIPDNRPIEDGDIINLDISVFYEGMHSDMNETFMIGNVDEESKRLVKNAYECLAAAVDICRPGLFYRDLGGPITRKAREENFSVVRTYCGHGVGVQFHPPPTIPHYAGNKAKGIMRAGHIFTVEPMINAGTHHDTVWPDDWTVVTHDGKRSAQFEHTFLCTENGVEILTQRIGADKHRMIWDEAYFSIPAEGRNPVKKE